MSVGVAAFLLAAVVWPGEPPRPSPLPSAVPSGEPAPGCTSPESRQFDFWIGDWAVYVKGELAGTNLVTSEFDGCVVQERWTSLAQRFAGSSFNHYDPGKGRWHQTWVDNAGGLLLLDGARDGRRMVLEGARRRPDGASIHDRISFEPLPGGRVRQLWESSTDGGKTWAVVFDGLYLRRGSKP